MNFTGDLAKAESELEICGFNAFPSTNLSSWAKRFKPSELTSPGLNNDQNPSMVFV
jgi:hypothetical protein